MIVPRLRYLSLALVPALVATAAGCGGSEESGALLSQTRANTLLELLDDAEQQFEDGECDALEDETLPALEEEIVGRLERGRRELPRGARRGDAGAAGPRERLRAGRGGDDDGVASDRAVEPTTTEPVEPTTTETAPETTTEEETVTEEAPPPEEDDEQ